jgi:hypothetical protein
MHSEPLKLMNVIIVLQLLMGAKEDLSSIQANMILVPFDMITMCNATKFFKFKTEKSNIQIKNVFIDLILKIQVLCVPTILH